MTLQERLQADIEYIEQHLKTDLLPEELARQAGYSPFHYYRLFCEVVGSPVHRFMTERRLSNALYDIAMGEKVMDVALMYGFDTHAGFYKAFRRIYGTSPKKYLKIWKPKKPTPYVLGQRRIIMRQQEIYDLLKQWDLPENAAVEEVCVTVFNIVAQNTWAIGPSYMLTLYTNERKLKGHLLLSEAMARRGYEAATAIPTKDGKAYVPYGGMFACLQKQLFGRALPSDRLLVDGRSETAMTYGRSIAHLHAALREVEQNGIFDRGDLFKDLEGQVMARTRAAMQTVSPLPDTWEADWQKSVAPFASTLPCQLIHRDLHADNLLTREDGQGLGFDAFDASLIYPRLFDPCYLATSVLSGCIDDPQKASRWFKLLWEILAGYDAIAPLTEAEKQAVPYVVMAIEMFFIAYLYGTDHPYHEVGNLNRRMLAFLIKHQDAMQAPA